VEETGNVARDSVPDLLQKRQNRGGPAKAVHADDIRTALLELPCSLLAGGPRPLRACLRTLQDRLPRELALAGITTIRAANRFLREVYLSEHNARFAVPTKDPASAFVAVPEALWRDGLGIQEERRGRTARGDGGAWVDHQ
jgi:hypothetical protein